jgi:hypothetical protein
MDGQENRGAQLIFSRDTLVDWREAGGTFTFR